MRADEEGAEMSLSYPFLHIPFIDGEQSMDDEDAVEGIEVGDIGLEEHGISATKLLSKERMREKDINGVRVGKTGGNVEESRKERKTEDCKERKEEKNARREEEKEILDDGWFTKKRENSEEEEERVNQDKWQQQEGIFWGKEKQGEDCVKSREESDDQKTDVAQHQRKIPRVETWCSSSMSKSPSAPLHQSIKSTKSTKSASPALSLGKLSGSKIGRSSSSPRLREHNR